MSKNKRVESGFGGFVFSTNPDFEYKNEETAVETRTADKQVLRIWLERMKGNKEATVIKGFVGSEDEIETLAKQLKNKCASGGNAKDGNIILQGDHREKVLKFLTEAGFKNVKKAGG